MASSIERLQGAIADRYVVERELGRGGMAVVYLARDLKRDRQVAIKVLLPDVALAVGPERFRREITLATRFSHPHILPLYDSGVADGSLYYVMPYVAGESLRDRLDREKQLPLEEAVHIAGEVADALDYAHRQGVVHRDIKPENILLEEGHALVADFGIARAAAQAGEDKLTRTGVTLGTPSYMSPEQAMGDREIDGRSDIYALGCVLYEMLGGMPPFIGPTAQAIIARHALDQVPSLTVVRRAIPDEIEDVVMCALAKVPADRFQTAREFAEALRAPSGATSTRRAITRGGIGVRRPSSSRTFVTLMTAAALLAAVAGIAAWRLTHRPTATIASMVGGLDPRHIAVLGFDDQSAAGDLGALSTALTDTLTADLGRVEGLTVVARGAASQFRAATVSADSIARALEAGTLVRGSIEREGERVHVAVRLIDGPSGVDFQRASFDLPARDRAGLSDTLAARVGSMISARIGRPVHLRTDR